MTKQRAIYRYGNSLDPEPIIAIRSLEERIRRAELQKLRYEIEQSHANRGVLQCTKDLGALTMLVLEQSIEYFLGA